MRNWPGNLKLLVTCLCGFLWCREQATSFPGPLSTSRKYPGYGWSRVYTCQLQTHRGWVLNKLQLQLQLSSPSLRSYLWNLLKSSRHVISRNHGTFSRLRGPWERGWWTRCRGNQLLVNLVLQKALNTEVHNATETNEENKDFITDSQPGYVLSIFLKFWLISASTCC